MQGCSERADRVSHAHTPSCAPSTAPELAHSLPSPAHPHTLLTHRPAPPPPGWACATGAPASRTPPPQTPRWRPAGPAAPAARQSCRHGCRPCKKGREKRRKTVGDSGKWKWSARATPHALLWLSVPTWRGRTQVWCHGTLPCCQPRQRRAPLPPPPHLSASVTARTLSYQPATAMELLPGCHIVASSCARARAGFCTAPPASPECTSVTAVTTSISIATAPLRPCNRSSSSGGGRGSSGTNSI